jgi:hypothetical protein
MHNVHVIFSFPFLSFIFSHRRCRFSSTATTGLRMHRLIAFLDGLETAVGHHYLSTSVTPLGIEERMTKSITAAAGSRCRWFIVVHHRLRIKWARITGLKTIKLLPPPPVLLQAQSAARASSNSSIGKMPSTAVILVSLTHAATMDGPRSDIVGQQQLREVGSSAAALLFLRRRRIWDDLRLHLWKRNGSGSSGMGQWCWRP